MENKTSINWYPGHMAKTKREIIEDLKLIDVVIEIIDARIPVSSQNPDIKQLTKNKKKIILLNKYDLADEEETKKWQTYFKQNNIPSILIDAKSGKGIDKVYKVVQEVMSEKLEEEAKKGRVGKTIRCAVVRNTKCTGNHHS